jgi:microcystin degradation protein MlrC
MDERMRIAFGGLHTECSTFNPLLMQTDDFRIQRGDALLAQAEFAPLRAFNANFLPTLHARAVPGGPISRTTYESLKTEFLDRLAALANVDGLYLAMHGASFVEGMEDAEGDWITAARRAVGPNMPISVSYDLHGNVSQRIIDAIDMFSAYRTAPHIDVEATKSRSVAMLLRCLQTGVRPGVAWAKMPVLLPGERTSTQDEPARGLYAGLAALEASDEIWDAALMVGYVWADEPRATASAIITGTDRQAMLNSASTLATSYWQARREFRFGSVTGTLAECLEMADASKTSPVILAESGDNPTGGGVGDRAEVLAALLERKATGVLLAGIADRPATEACYAAGEGAMLNLQIGATLDPAGSAPVSVHARVRRLAEAEAAERMAVVEIGGIEIVLTARRRPFHDFSDFTCLGLDPRQVRLLVVKSGYLSPDLAPIAAPNLMALTPGVVDQDVTRAPRRRVKRPCFPFDAEFDWEPQPMLSARFSDTGA